MVNHVVASRDHSSEFESIVRINEYTSQRDEIVTQRRLGKKLGKDWSNGRFRPGSREFLSISKR